MTTTVFFKLSVLNLSRFYYLEGVDNSKLCTSKNYNLITWNFIRYEIAKYLQINDIRI